MTTTTQTEITHFLNSINTKWFPINLEVIEGKKILKYTNDYMPKPTDFKMLTNEEILERQKYLKDYEFIAIETCEINQIDVDTDKHEYEVEELKERLPYFMSASKGYPHLFCMFNEPIALKRVQTVFEGIEVLSGQWSYCRADAIVYNSSAPIHTLNNSMLKGHTQTINNFVNKTPLLYSDVNIEEVLTHLDVKFCDKYDDWFRIGCALINSGFSFEIFDKFSQKSEKYSYLGVSALWRQLERSPMEQIQFGTIMYYLKESDPIYFKKIQKELKSLNQIEEVKKLLATGHVNHSIVAKIFYEGFNWKYQYSSGHWYRLSKGGIFQKLTKDAEVFIAKEMKEYLQGFLTDVKDKITDEDKRKKLWAAMGLIESNSFKMACVAEAKQDFMNENLYKELDTKDNLIGFNNGVYDLETMSFRVGTIEDKISLTTGYDYSANYDVSKSKFIDEMINGYFKTPETARWFKKHLGSLLVAGNKEEKGYFWVGNGRNGKGTIDAMLINTLGNYYYKLQNEFFTVAKKNAGGPEPEILAMKNKRLCMTHEPEGSAKYLTSKFKTNTGNDPMSARQMYSDLIEQFNPSHKTIIQTNHLPEFTDVDHGLLARLVVIKFPYKYCDSNDFDVDNENHKRIDQNLKSKLKGIENDFVNYLIQWYGVYKVEGLQDISPEINASIVEYRKEVDSVKAFIEEALIKTNDEEDKVSTVSMLAFHNLWSKQKLRSQSFVKRLKANDLDIVRTRIDGSQGAGLIGYTFNKGFIDTLEDSKNENKFREEEE